MKVTRHVHFLDSPTKYPEGVAVPHKTVSTFDPPRNLGSTIGKIEVIYPLTLFAHSRNKMSPETIFPIVKNVILHIRELMKAGEVLSVELRVGHCLRNLTLDPVHSLQLLAGDTGLLYWITVGREGHLEVTGQVVKDTDGVFRKLKSDLTDTTMRDYLVKRSLADSGAKAEEAEQVADVMTHAQAAHYLQLSPKTLYNNRAIPRLKHNRYRKEDLDRYLQGKRR